MMETEVEENTTVLFKQNPFKPSKKALQVLKTLKLEGMNVNNAYTGELTELLAKKSGTLEENVILFRSENEALKKIFELFIPKNSNILIETPKKIDVKINFSFLSANNAPDKIWMFKLLNNPTIKIWITGNTLRYPLFTNEITGIEKK